MKGMLNTYYFQLAQAIGMDRLGTQTQEDMPAMYMVIWCFFRPRSENLTIGRWPTI
uniref:Uncharacterized protein n=1 Tax=Setaria italica TaxID=4555 RepID=K3ZBR7_SETIT